MRKDKTGWGFKSVDAINFGTDLVKIFYQDPKDSSINWFDYNKKKNKFTAYGQVLAPGKAVLLSSLTVVTWYGEEHQRIRIYYCDNAYLLKEINFDDGINPKAGPLDARKVTAYKGTPLAAAVFKRDDVANIRLYYVGVNKNLREYVWGAGGKKEWQLGPIVRENIQIDWTPRLSCINLRPWSDTSPAIRLFGYDFIDKLYEYQWNEGGWGTSKYPPEFKFSPANNSIDCVATRIDTDKPRSFVFYVIPYRDTIMERVRIGEKFETQKQTIKLDRVHPFAVLSDPLPDMPDHMHMFLTNGRDFIRYERSSGKWTEKPIPQVNDKDDFTDVESIKYSIDATKA